MIDFVHTHVHSHFSIGDGLSTPKELIKQTIENNQKAVALTDHGNACGLYEFWKECKNQKIKSLCGIEAYLAQQVKVEDEEGKLHKDTTYHAVLIAKNDAGYRDICKLIYKSNKDTFYYRPMILFDDLFSIEQKNIIISTACVGGILNRHFLSGDDEKAYETAKRFKDFFRDDFYIELQLNCLNEQKVCNEKLIKLAKDLDLKLIITNDVHYVKKDQANIQDVLKLIIRKKTVNEVKENPDESPYSTVRDNYLCIAKDFFDFNRRFGFDYSESFIDDALSNTNEIADKCSFNFDTKTKKFPKIQAPQDSSIEAYFEKLCFDSLNIKINENVINESQREVYEKQLLFEIKVINDSQYTDYFLIFYDLFRFVRENDIWSGPGRGSVAGSLVAFLLGITMIDPIKYKLQFVRFINPTRVSLPDIDSDFDSDRKEEIELYLKKKYGEDSVLHVATFNEFHLRGILRDIARVFDRDYDEVNVLNKLLDKDLPVTIPSIKEYLESLDIKEVKEYLSKNKDLVKYYDSLYAKLRFCGKHAAGIVIFDGPAYKYIPVIRLHGEILTAFKEGMMDKHMSEINLLKLDILGLDTISIIKDCVALVKKSKVIDLKRQIYNIDLEDKNIFKTINDYENSGIFQMESPGINKLCKAIKPSTFEDVVAISCLYRPGSLQSGLAFSYASSKNDPTKKIDSGVLNKYLESTHGIIIYQEQLTECLADLLSYSLGEADLWRKPFSRGFRNDYVGDVSIDIDSLYQEFDKRPDLKKFVMLFYDRIKISHPELDVIQQEKILKYMLGYVGYSFNKCLDGSSLVTFENGKKKKISSIRSSDIGRKIKTTNNKYVPIKKKHLNGKKKLYKLTTETGKQLICSLEHKLMTKNGLKPLKEILENDLEVLCQ